MSESPSRSQVHVVRPLTNILIAEMQADDVYIANKAVPQVPVTYQSDLYYSMPKDDWFRTVAQDRAPATESVGVTYQLNPNNRYDCRIKAVHFDLADQTRANYSTPFDAEKGATMIVASNMNIKMELDFFQTFFRPGVWAGLTGSTGLPVDFDCSTSVSKGQWDLASSDPIADVAFLQSEVQSQTGRKPNKLIISKDVYTILKNHPAFIQRIQYSQLGVTTEQLIAKMFDVDDMMVAEAVLNSSQEGQLANMGFMSTNCFLLAYSPATPQLMAPSAWLKFNWTGYDAASGLNTAMRVFRMEHLRATRYEAEICYDMKVVCPDCAVFGVNVLSKPY